MAEDRRMTADQVVDKLMSCEHTDVLRESVAWVVAELMEAEISAQIGAEHGERAPGERTSQGNGYRPRPWSTRAGELELAIPRLRPGSYFPLFAPTPVVGATGFEPATARPPADDRQV